MTLSNSKRPLLVTGTHRSGTTWVGEMLAQSPEVHYIHEPFAPMYERSWIPNRPATRYLYTPPETRNLYTAELQQLVRLRPPWLRIALRAGGLRNGVRLAQEAWKTRQARRRKARPLVKDPFLLLSAEWFARATNAQVVILVRHPAAFVSSIKRLGWRMDTSWLLNQDPLMTRFLAPFKEELEHDILGETDLIDHGCLVWNALNTVTRYYEEACPEFQVLRYEDLAENPESQFERLYKNLDISWTVNTQTNISRLNSVANPIEVNDGTRGGTNRDSRKAMWTWKNRLNRDEINRVYAATEELAPHWYGISDW